jgi:hypothetical protein
LVKNRQWKRLIAGFAALCMIAAVTVIGAANALAYTPGTDQPNTFNGGSPANAATGTATLGVLAPGSSSGVTTNYTYASYTAVPGGAAASAPTSIRIMWQQWRHDTQNEWFYLYARNTNNATAASISGSPMWSFFYYNRARGSSTQIASTGTDGAASSAGASSAANGLSAATIYLDAGSTVPAFLVTSVAATTSVAAGCAGPVCPASLSATLQWGTAQEGFKTGIVTITQAVESFPLGPSGAQFVYYDAWESPMGAAGSLQLSLTDTAPTQSATGVTNASGTRFTGTAYPMTQTIGDTNGDLQSGSLLFVQTAGTQVGQWFTIGLMNGDDNGNTISPAGGTTFYQSWNESRVVVAGGSPLVTNYLSSATSTGAGTATAETITYSLTFTAGARGTWNVFGRAEDYHGASSSNVMVGTVTVQ